MNPFDITKAVDYTNEELNEYWVDFPTPFVDIIKPTSQMPMIVLGGKGSGKTHVMTYFSYELQKLRYKEDLLSKLIDDKYIGIYWRCSGLNGSRFSNKGRSEDFWKTIFEYYSELWVGDKLLRIVQDINAISNGDIIDSSILEKITELFDEEPDVKFNSIEDVLQYLQKLQKQLSREVNNLIFLNGDGFSEGFKIHVSPTKFFFGLPQILANEIRFFQKMQFVYLIDEYENLQPYQQKYYNTLIREKEYPTTFKIGARHYGMFTYETYSGREEIKEGSEFELFNLDDFLRQQDEEGRYKKYVIDICLKRLKIANYNIDEEEFVNSFEKFDSDNINEYLKPNREKKYLKHIEHLIIDLNTTNIEKQQISDIIDLISFETDVLIEKTNVYILYKYIKKNGIEGLIDKAKGIRENINNSNFKEQKDILAYYKNDFIDQLMRENNLKIPYWGLENYIRMSSGIPRTLIRILKEVYKQAEFNDEKPFEYNKKISLKAQLQGVSIACKGILDDFGNDENVKNGLIRIGALLQTKRFSDLPPECSISIFKISIVDINDNIARLLKPLKDYSYLIEVEERREKNGDLKDRTFKLNGAIAPIWELSLFKRGVIHFNKYELNVLLGENSENFRNLIEIEKKKYNFPFNKVSSVQTKISF